MWRWSRSNFAGYGPRRAHVDHYNINRSLALSAACVSAGLRLHSRHTDGFILIEAMSCRVHRLSPNRQHRCRYFQNEVARFESDRSLHGRHLAAQ